MYKTDLMMCVAYFQSLSCQKIQVSAYEYESRCLEQRILHRARSAPRARSERIRVF